LVLLQDGSLPKYYWARDGQDLRRQINLAHNKKLVFGAVHGDFKHELGQDVYIYVKDVPESKLWSEEVPILDGLTPAAWVISKEFLRNTIKPYAIYSDVSNGTRWGFPVLASRKLSPEERLAFIAEAVGHGISLTWKKYKNVVVPEIENPCPIPVEGKNTLSALPQVIRSIWMNTKASLGASIAEVLERLNDLGLPSEAFYFEGDRCVLKVPSSVFDRRSGSMVLCKIRLPRHSSLNDKQYLVYQYLDALAFFRAKADPTLLQGIFDLQQKMATYSGLRRWILPNVFKENDAHIRRLLDDYIVPCPAPMGSVRADILRGGIILRQEQLAIVEEAVRRETLPDQSIEDRFFFKIGLSEDCTTELFYSPFFRDYAAVRRVGAPAKYRGGLIVAPIGFGKSFCALALLAASPVKGPTLIACPEAIIPQWMSNCQTHTTMRCHLFDGTSMEYGKGDIVFVSYKTLKSNSEVMKVEWARVIYDEIHVAPQDARHIQAPIKWGMTATLTTPTRACIESILSLVHVFEVHSNEFLLYSIRRCTTTLERIINDVFLDQLCLLPPKTSLPGPSWTVSHTTLPAPMPEDLRSIYETMRETIVERGWKVDDKIAVHVLRKIATGHASTQPPRSRFKRRHPDSLYEEGECAICQEPYAEEAATIRCGHVFCTQCLVMALMNKSQCPLCRSKTDVSSIISVEEARDMMNARYLLELSASGNTEGEESTFAEFFDYRAQMAADIISSSGSDDKYLVFSGYKHLLHRTMQLLKQRGIGVYEVAGRLTPKRNKEAFEKFAADPDAKVLMIDLVWGNAGLNLTAANNVLFLETPYDDILREQAIGRAARRGQMRSVHVTTLVDPQTGY